MNPSLELGPILRSLRHHKGTFSLLVLEVALGFVMLTHTLIIARYYFHLHVRPNGMPEDELVVARRRFLHPRDATAARATVRADLAALGRTGAAAAAIDATPLPERGAFPIALARPGDAREQFSWPVRATPGIAAALGLQLVAGTGLDAVSGAPDAHGATPVLLTRTAAETLFGIAGDAVGKDRERQQLRARPGGGVVRDFAFRGGWLPAATSIVIVAAEPITEHEILYVLRAPGGRRAAVIEAATPRPRRHRRRRLDGRDPGSGTDARRASRSSRRAR